jgi:hypothetical protein
MISGSVPVWGWVAWAVSVLAALLVGMWAGYGRGVEHAEEDAGWEQADAAVRPGRHRGAPQGGRIRLCGSCSLFHIGDDPCPAELARAEWLIHETEALAVANEEPAPLALVAFPEQDEIGCTAWTAAMAADMDRWLDEHVRSA